jgi:non-heme chloroperoxidase
MSTIQSIALSTGITVPYVEVGDADGLPVVLLHGYTDSWRSYELMLEHLPRSVHAYALTQRGHGDADKPAKGYAPSDYGRDLAAFMDAMDLEAAVVVGHSGGSYTAQRFAIDHPQRTLGLVLMGAFHSFRGNPAIAQLWQAVREFSDPVDPEFVQAFQASCAAQPIPPDFLASVVAESCKVPAHVWKAAAAGLISAEVPTESGRIDAPTLILWGDRDELCPRSDQDALVAAIPGAQLVTYAGTGHSVHWEQPARCAADITAFARRCAAPTLSKVR